MSMDNVFVTRSAIAGASILGGCLLIGIGSDKEIACVFGGVAMLFYAFAVMLTMPKKGNDDE